MISTDKGHFWLTFENGYTISVFNGFGSYSENHFKRETISTSEFASVDSKDCEVAISYEGIFCTNRFINCNDSVIGYISPDELAKLIYKVKEFDGDSNA